VKVKVLLVVIDAATPHVVCPAIQTGRLRTLQRLADAGSLHESSASIFPSITPAATTSIITGAYPAEHGIAGAAWFDEQRNEVAYYGDDFWVIARKGFGEFINEFLLRLNGDRLRAPTLFEMVERSGRTAACLNYLVFRGNQSHRVDMPGLIAALPGVPLTETVEGPSILHLGDFVGGRAPGGRKLDKKSGPLHRFGLDDASSGALLASLFGSQTLPDLTVAYFADNDFRSHEVGPFAALPVIERVDGMLGDAFDAAGGIDRVLEDTCVIVTSDHGHCDVLDRDDAIIRLDRVFGEFRQAELGRPWHEHDEIMICPNMRAAQIYVHRITADLVDRIAREALLDPRIDQVIWRTSNTNPGADGYTVLTSHGRLTFTRRPADSGASEDPFGGRWRWEGESDAVDLLMDGSTIEFGQYPNAFERIAGVLDFDQSGAIWITARPGCEFEAPGGKPHVGGASHGALHALDSHSPVLIAGGPVRPRLSRHFRCIDIAPLCMQLLNVPMRYVPAMPRGSHALDPVSPRR
jgi:hypothetical protein